MRTLKLPEDTLLKTAAKNLGFGMCCNQYNLEKLIFLFIHSLPLFIGIIVICE